MGKPRPCDASKYAAAKSRIYAKYKTHGAYRSMAVVKAYKAAGGRYCGGSKSSGGTTRWQKEKWRAPGGKKDFGGQKAGRVPSNCQGIQQDAQIVAKCVKEGSRKGETYKSYW